MGEQKERTGCGERSVRLVSVVLSILSPVIAGEYVLITEEFSMEKHL